MPARKNKSRIAPAYGLHPQFRQVYGESFSAGSEGALLRIGVGSLVPEQSENGSVRRVVTDFELLIDPPGAEYLLDILTKWLAEVRSLAESAERSKPPE